MNVLVLTVDCTSVAPMRFRGMNAGRGTCARRLAAVATLAALIAGGAAASDARAADSSVLPYGQVAAVGSLDTGADYLLQNSTTDLTEGDFVDPVGMTIAPDSSSPGGEDIYVLDLVNPQALNGLITTDDTDTVSLEYRLQKIAIAPSTAQGEDTGSETVLACTTFTLASTPSAPDQHAVSLAVDGPENRVDVLVNEMPDFKGAPSNYSIAYQVDEWPTSLEGGAAGTCPATPAASLGDPVVPSTTLVKKNDPGLQGDIDGDSIAFAGTGTGAQLALGGSEYLSNPASTQIPRTEPIIKLFSGQTVARTWTKSENAANAIAKSAPIAGKDSAPGWGIDQTSVLRNGDNNGGSGDVLYALSSNPDGTLNVTLGPQEYQLAAPVGPSGADLEPIMATVSADLSTTTPVLPSPEASPTYNYPPGWNVNDVTPSYPDVNSEIAATDAAEQDTGDGAYATGSSAAPAGGTDDGGTLAPSVVALAGSAAGLYAGYVADDLAGTDTNLDQNGDPVAEPAWTVPNPTLGGATANYGVRVFTGCGTSGPCASGTPVAMIGNAGSGACSIRSGAYGDTQTVPASTIALAAGPNGTVYALTQPDLDAVTGGMISPAHPVSGAGVGDILMEFQPGAGSGTSPGVACPQPSGSFSATDESNPSATPDSGTGTVEVTAGATIQFDASPIDLQGGVPWTYSWDAPGAAGAQPQPSTFEPDPTNPVYDRANPTQTFVFATPGQSTATLQLQSDFGTTTVSRPIDVVAPGPIVADVSAAAGAVAGEPTTLSAAGTTVDAPDSIVDYHWDFGNGTSDDTSGPSEIWTFPSAGTYTVTLTAIDQVGRTQTATTQVNVAPPPPAPAPAPTTSTPVPSSHAAPRFSVSPKLRSMAHNAELSAKLSCPAGDSTCAGTIAVLTAGKVSVPGRKGKHLLSLGKGTFSVTAAHSRTVLLRLAAVTQKLISPQQPLKLAIVVVAHDSAGARATQRLALYLFPPRGSRPRKFG